MRPLSELAKDIELSDSLDSLAAGVELRRVQLSTLVASEILTLFRLSVLSTVLITVALVVVDAVMLTYHVIKPDERLVSERVLLALIGASVVHVGAASAAIAYGLFGQSTPEPSTNEENEPT